MLSLTAEERRGLWNEMTEAIEEYIGSVRSHRVTPNVGCTESVRRRTTPTLPRSRSDRAPESVTPPDPVTE